MAIVEVGFEEDRRLVPQNRWRQAVSPYPGSSVDPAALKVTGIDPDDPNREAIDEAEAFRAMFRRIRRAVRQAGCQRAILVAHNAAFDQQFMQQAFSRNELKRSPFHPFSFIDTASLAAVSFGHTVLSEACSRAGIEFDTDRAHNALYDAEKAAELFCEIVNRWQPMFDAGLPPAGYSASSGFGAALLISGSSSPLSNISVTMSQPPISSPCT